MTPKPEQSAGGPHRRERVLHSLKWSFLSALAPKLIQPLVFIVMARVLTPEDYGVVAAAVMVLSFTQVFSEAGMGRAVVKFQGDGDAAATAAFWLNNALGLLVAGSVFLGANVISAHLFHDARVAAVLRVMCLQVLLSSAGAIHSAILQRDMRFDRLFRVGLATLLVPPLVSVPLAIAGWRYWALVAGTLASQLVQLGMLWRMSPWRPGFHISSELLLRLLRFGGWVAGSSLLTWGYLWADSLIIGMYLGAKDLGLYRIGNQLVGTIYGMVFGPLLPVLYSYFSSIQEDRDRVRAVLRQITRISTLVGLSGAIVLYAGSVSIEQLLFGAKWQGVSAVVALLGLTHGFAWIVGANGEAYRAIGKPHYDTAIMAGGLPIYLVVYRIAVEHGLQTFLHARFMLALAALTLNFWVAKAALKFPVRETIQDVAKLVLVGCPVFVLARAVPNALAPRILVTITACMWVLACVWLLERRRIIPDVLRIISRRRPA